MENQNTKSIKDLIKKHIKSLENKEYLKKVIRTGFANLDEIIGGFVPGELIVIGGRPGMGKTQFLVNLTMKISEQVPVLYVNNELSEQALAFRFISLMADVDLSIVYNNELEKEDKERIKSLDTIKHNNKVFIHHEYFIPIHYLQSICRKPIEENGVKVIVLDCLQLMVSERGNEEREEAMGYVIREIKKLAREKEVCVVVTSQLSRNVDLRGGTKRPELYDLRDGGAIEEEADKVLLLYRPEYYNITYDENGEPNDGLTELIVAKNKNGKLGYAKLKVDDSFIHFTDKE
ncbi:MAG: DnaB-like helicase C-terminal domain-containing protein [Bacteroidota bacterium]